MTLEVTNSKLFHKRNETLPKNRETFYGPPENSIQTHIYSIRIKWQSIQFSTWWKKGSNNNEELRIKVPLVDSKNIGIFLIESRNHKKFQ